VAWRRYFVTVTLAHWGIRSMLETVLSIAEHAIRAPSGAQASEALRDALLPRGLSYLQVRHYRRPRGRLTSAAHWAAGGFVSRYVRPGWVGSARCW